MHDMRLKAHRCEFKLDSTGRTFEGYASTFGNVDFDSDIILPGAFTKTVAEAFPANKIKVLWNHSWDKLIGKPLVMEQDSKGLYTKTHVSDTTLGRDLIALMSDNVLDRMSIGFWVPAGKQATRPDGIREISEIALMEYSPVTFPANDQAIISGVKSLREMINFFKSGDVSDRVKDELQHEFAEIKALLTGQPLRTEPDHSRDLQDLAALLKQFTPPN